MMNKLVIYFDQTDIDSLMPVGPIPKCLIFHNYYDAVDWLKRHDCKWEEKFPDAGEFTINRFGRTVRGKYMWGEAYL